MTIYLEDQVYFQNSDEPGAQNSDKFLPLAERNNDMKANSFLPEGMGLGYSAFADNFASIQVVSDKEWDADHPAGKSLNDKILLRYQSYADYVRNNYTLTLYDCPETKAVLLSEVLPGDLWMILCPVGPDTEYAPTLYFTESPVDSPIKHTFTITLTTTEGDIKSVSITCTPEVDPKLQL